MDRHFKSDLKKLVSDYAVQGRGPFGQWVHVQGISAPSMTNRELANGLIDSYGLRLILQLRKVKLAKFYELDVASVVGAHRSRLVLGVLQKRLDEAKATRTQIKGNDAQKKVFGWLGVLVTVVAIFHFVGSFSSEDTASDESTASEVKSSAGPVKLSTASRVEDFHDCAAYLGISAGLQCFNHAGGNNMPGESSEASHARYELQQMVWDSRWSTDTRCKALADSVTGQAIAEASPELAQISTNIWPPNPSMITAISNACLQAGNMAAYRVCDSVPGGCGGD